LEKKLGKKQEKGCVVMYDVPPCSFLLMDG